MRLPTVQRAFRPHIAVCQYGAGTGLDCQQKLCPSPAQPSPLPYFFVSQ